MVNAILRGLKYGSILSPWCRLKLSIIIPAYNEERLLGATLQEIDRACAAVARRGWTHEVIVCDNNSSDATAGIARAAGARVVFEPVNQIARARNKGASVAVGEWLLFIDADSHPSAGLFEDMLSVMVEGRCVAGGAEIQMDTCRPVARFFNGLWNRISRWGILPAGSFIFVETAVFRAIGGFSEALYAGEELELTERLKAVASEQHRKLVILRRHPLRTSARKVELYTVREMGWFFLKALVARKRVLGSREACHPWYDGRR
ncbi:MAG: glycosyltransferase [Verrucomicrobia bacterium]|nr:glycosyltransferase [Verrucomicrobiota bacterium]